MVALRNGLQRRCLTHSERKTPWRGREAYVLIFAVANCFF
jgi:hypothetical protein